MSDEAIPDTADSLAEKHRKEKKSLQARIQLLKKSVTKGDKKKKKEVDEQIEQLESEFQTKCTLELDNLKKEPTVQSTFTPAAPAEAVLDEPSNGDEEKKLSKARKKREKKEKEDAERDKRIQQQEVDNRTGPAFLELTAIKQRLKLKSLQLKEQIPDGNCLYYSMCDQLKRHMSLAKTCQELRDMVCDYMLLNKDEFQPYLFNEDEIASVSADGGDDPSTSDESYRRYCEQIRSPAVWGGHVELKALCDLFNVLVVVVQAEGAEIRIGNEVNQMLTITYHRHMFAGEHYNSTEPLVQVLDD